MKILKGFKIVFISENNSVSSEHEASDCDKSSSVTITLYRHKLNRKMSWRLIMSYYILSSNKLPLQVMNSFVPALLGALSLSLSHPDTLMLWSGITTAQMGLPFPEKKAQPGGAQPQNEGPGKVKASPPHS